MLVTPLAQEDQTFLGLPVLRDSGDPTRTVQTAANLIHSSAAAVRTAEKLGGDWTRNKVLEAIERHAGGREQHPRGHRQGGLRARGARLANTFVNSALEARREC